MGLFYGARSALGAWSLDFSEGRQDPLIRYKSVTKDIKLSVVRTNLEEGVIRTVPLIQNFLDHVLVSAKLKRDGTLVRFPSRIALHAQAHLVGLGWHSIR